MTELTGEKLLFDDDGNGIGVQAKYYDGTTYEIYGKTVILATGGFLGNQKRPDARVCWFSQNQC